MTEKIIPGLKPQPINYELYCEYTPEKCVFEFIDGMLLGDIKKLLIFLMYHVGLEETVKLVPKELWEQALNTLHD